MLASTAESPFTAGGWIFEPKLDGMRAIAVVRNGEVRLLSRRGLRITHQYPSLAQEIVQQCGLDAILDGEIIALDGNGRPSFQQLQQRMNLIKDMDIRKIERRLPVYYFIFDAIFCQTYDISYVPLRIRKQILMQIVQQSTHVRLLEFFTDDGQAAYDACITNGFEGIVAKRFEGAYEVGRRSASWIKVKAQHTSEFVIAGYSSGQGSRAPTFGSLVLGYYDEIGTLHYAGSVGTGFDGRLLAEMMRLLQPLQIAACPIKGCPADKRDSAWISPTLVAEIKFMDWTRDGHLRNPVFLRLRDEILAQDVRRLEPVAIPVTINKVTSTITTGSASRDATDDGIGFNTAQASNVVPVDLKKYSDVLEQLNDRHQNITLMVAGDRIPVTNLDREFWPASPTHSGGTKRDFLRYLCMLGPLFLQQLKDRPLTIIRVPYGVKGRSFFQKHWRDIPEFVETVHGGDAGELLLCNNLQSLFWFAQNRCVEFHTWLARVKGAFTEAPHPDMLVIDLDYHIDSPNADQDGFAKVQEVANLLGESLMPAGLISFLKTSGRTGMHLVIPVTGGLDFAATNMLASTICGYVAQRYPKLVTLELVPERRGDRVLLDCSPNGFGKNLLAPYSPRSVPGARVSTPIDWSELDKVKPADFTVHTLPERLTTVGDLWNSAWAVPNDFSRILART